MSDLATVVSSHLVKLGLSQPHIDTVIGDRRMLAFTAALFDLRYKDRDSFERMTELLWAFLDAAGTERAKFLAHVGLPMGSEA
jgi:hypothetical protein